MADIELQLGNLDNALSYLEKSCYHIERVCSLPARLKIQQHTWLLGNAPPPPEFENGDYNAVHNPEARLQNAVNNLKTDDSFAPIRDTERFQAIVNRLETLGSKKADEWAFAVQEYDHLGASHRRGTTNK